MSKQQYDTHLRYGQGILIEGFKSQGNNDGLMTAQGFADIKVKYETYDELIYFKNYRNAIFQILPAGNFQLNDELHKALIQNQGNTEESKNIKILRDRADSEKYQFQINIQNKMKQKICFGAGVVFKHVDSESFLSGTIKPSGGTNGAFTVQVSEKLSQALIFKLMPYRSFEFTDMPIPLDSPILIKNDFNNGYLTFQKFGMGSEGNQRVTYIEKKPIQSNDTYKIPIKTQSQKSDTYEVVTYFVDLGSEKVNPMPWRFKLHVNDVINDALIQHDIVYLRNTENSGILSTISKNIILKELKEPSDQLKFYECLWEIEKHDATNDSYILRHLMSGMIMGVEKTEHDTNQATLMDISLGKVEGQEIPYIEIKNAKKTKDAINSDSFVSVCWGQQILECTQNQPILKNSVNQNLQGSRVDLGKMRQIYSKQIQYHTKFLAFNKSVSQEHCFVISEIDDDLKKQLLFALSFHKVIINLREDLKWGAIAAAKKISYLRMMMVNQKIKEIKNFIKNCTEEEAGLEHIYPMEKRQMICKDLGISELLFELLYFMRMNLKEDIFSDKHNEKQKFLDLYNTLYEVIRELIRNNKLFKMHISKWFEFILEDVINNNVPEQIAVIKELLKENDFFINNFITEDLIKYLTNNFLLKKEGQQFYEIKYLDIFRSLCIVGQNVNTQNQKLIFDFFIKTLKDEGSIFNVELLMRNQQILISSSVDKSSTSELSVGDFYNNCQQNNPSAWEYFVGFLNLCADLVQGRNKVTETEITKYFSLEIVIQLFESDELHQAEVPIIRLLHYLYAQSEVYYPIERKRKLLNYNTLKNVQEIQVITSTCKQKPWQPPFDRVLATLTNKLKQYQPISPEQVLTNEILLTLLKCLWQTLNLGFWVDKAQVKQILNDVLHILSKSDVIQDYESVKVETYSNILMIKCKKQCLNIVQYICDYDRDIFVQILAAKFKDYPMPGKVISFDGIIANRSAINILKADDTIVNAFITSLPPEQQIQPIVQTSICDHMIEVSNYDNPELTSKAIGIIDRVLNTRRKSIEQFYDLILISEEERLEMLNFMDQHRNKFFILEDPNIVNVDQDNQGCNYYMVKDAENLGIMEVLYLITELMKNENNILEMKNIRSIDESGIFEALGSNRLINFTAERSSTSRMKQQLIYSTNLHLKVLNYIFNCTQFPETTLALKLLHMCYYFIVSLIENFNQIKTIMQWHIPKVIHHIKKNVGCIDFLKEMYDNNKIMLYNQMVVFDLIKEICENIQGEPEDSYYKSKLLDFFRFLIYLNGKGLKNNQIQILKIMQDDSYTNIMIKCTVEQMDQMVQQYQKDNQQGKDVIVMSPKLTYVSTMFQILGSLIDNNHVVNIGKLIKKYPFDLLVAYIKLSRNCWPLKRNIRGFVNKLYYFRPEIETQLKAIITTQFPLFLQDLDSYIIQTLDSSSLNINKKFQSPVRFTYLASYQYLLIQQILFSLFVLSTKEKVSSQIVNYINNFGKTEKQTIYAFFKVTERMAYLQRYFDDNRNVYTKSMIKFILTNTRTHLENISEKNVYSDGISPQNQEGEEYEKYKNLLITKMLDGKIKNFFEEKKSNSERPLSYDLKFAAQKTNSVFRQSDKEQLSVALRVIFQRQKKQFNNEDERIYHDLERLMSNIKLSTISNNYMKGEFIQKVQTYYAREDRFQYITRIIAINSKYPTAFDSGLKIFFLNFITGLVVQANKGQPQVEGGQTAQGGEVVEQQNQEAPLIQNKPEEGEEGAQGAQGQGAEGAEQVKQIDEWEADDYGQHVEDIVKAQNDLKKCDLGKFIVELLKEDIINDIQLANSILLCAISYLLGGNTPSQRNIIEQLQNDSENKVFENIEMLIVKLGKLIRKNIDEANIKEEEILEGGFNLTTVDNYDFYDVDLKYALRKNVFQPNSTDQYIFSKLCITTYRRIFKFLQLICENDNRDGKNFIRTQPGKSKQFNFIEITTKELRNLFQIYCDEIREVPLFLLDFILEVTQIPIYENQRTLMFSTFFEDLCSLKKHFKDPISYEQRNFQYQCDYIQDILFKSIKIIQSNFEGNDFKTYQILDNKLQPDFLQIVVSQKLQKMKISKKKDLVSRIDEYSNKLQGGLMQVDFDEDILKLLDVVTVFLKIQSAFMEFNRLLPESVQKKESKIVRSYLKFKKNIEEDYRTNLANAIKDEVKQQEFDAKLEQQMASYQCMYSHLETCLRVIEINDGNDKNQLLYFPNYPVFNSLSGQLRDTIMKSLPIGSHRDKIVGLLGYTEAVRQKMQFSFNLKNIQKITQDNMNNSFKIASILSIFLCAYIWFFYKISIEYNQAQYYSDFPIGLICFIISLIQLDFTILYVYYWVKLKLWFQPETINRTGQSVQQEQKVQQEVQPQEEVQKGVLTRVGEWVSVKKQAILANKYMAKVVSVYNFIQQERASQQQRIYKNLNFWRVFMFLISSIIATFYWPPLFFIHLIDIFARVQQLGTILYSVIYKFDVLMSVNIMAVIFTYIFCVVTFSNYMVDIYADGQKVDEMCSSILDCVMKLKLSGVIEESMDQFESVRYTYDSIYGIFFGTFFANIVGGIMIDAFQGLRGEAQEMESDRKNKCYICNVSRQSLQQKWKVDFCDHTNGSHFLWNYIFYILVLQTKDETDYTGLQYYIRTQYYLPDEEMEVSWIPDNGSSEFDIATEAGNLSNDIKGSIEPYQEKVVMMEDFITEFKDIAKDYIK